MEENSKKFNNNCCKFNTNFILEMCNFLHITLPSIDCFASSMNTQCHKYISFLDDLSSIGVDFFKMSNKICWRDEIVWANPPFTFSIIQKTVDHFINYHIRGFLLLPRWPNQY